MTNDIDTLLDESEGLEYGPARTALCEEAAQLADSRGDVEGGFRARMKLTAAAAFGGQPDLELLSFSWVLSQLDRRPDLFEARTRDVLWQYKWVVTQAVAFPHLSKEKILELLDDMEKRYAAYGSTLNAVHHKRRAVYESLGDRKASVAAQKKWDETPRDSLSDCMACCRSGMVDFFTFLGRYDLAVEEGRKVLDYQMSCASVPQSTYGHLLHPLFKLGELDLAMRHHRTGFPLVANKPGHLDAVRQHVEFLTLTDNTVRALDIAADHFGLVMNYPTPSMHRSWFTTLRLLFAHLAQSGANDVRFRFPENHPLRTKGNRLPAKTLFEWFDREAWQLAKAFDTRNGNTYYIRRIRQHTQLLHEITTFPFSRKRTLPRSDADE